MHWIPITLMPGFSREYLSAAASDPSQHPYRVSEAPATWPAGTPLPWALVARTHRTIRKQFTVWSSVFGACGFP